MEFLKQRAKLINLFCVNVFRIIVVCIIVTEIICNFLLYMTTK